GRTRVRSSTSRILLFCGVGWKYVGKNKTRWIARFRHPTEPRDLSSASVIGSRSARYLRPSWNSRLTRISGCGFPSARASRILFVRPPLAAKGRRIGPGTRSRERSVRNSPDEAFPSLSLDRGLRPAARTGPTARRGRARRDPGVLRDCPASRQQGG